MGAAIDRGLVQEGVLPGGLGVARRAWVIHRKMTIAGSAPNRFELLYAYALAVAEENASGRRGRDRADVRLERRGARGAALCAGDHATARTTPCCARWRRPA